MSQHVVAIRNEIQGLYIKGIGTFHAGAQWSIESAPQKLIEKIVAGDMGKNKKGAIVPICSFITAEGNIVSLRDAYIPKFKIGKPPPPVREFESSKKSRFKDKEEDSPEIDDEDKKELAEDDDDSEKESDDAEFESPKNESVDEDLEAAVKKKKVLKKKKS